MLREPPSATSKTFSSTCMLGVYPDASTRYHLEPTLRLSGASLSVITAWKVSCVGRYSSVMSTGSKLSPRVSCASTRFVTNAGCVPGPQISVDWGADVEVGGALVTGAVV